MRAKMRLYYERFHKYIKGIIQRYGKGTRWNWPELHLYCGMCDLKTGLYIRSIFSLFIYATIVIFNVLILYYLLETGSMLGAMDISDVEEYLGIVIPDEKMAKIKVLYKVVISYLMFWIFFKFVYLAVLFLTIYAIYKKQPKMLKYVIYINFLNWMVDIFISGLGAALMPLASKLLIILCVFFEGYNLIALNSEYKQLKGKSKLLMNMDNTFGSADSVTANLPTDANVPEESVNLETNPDEVAISNDKHCESCTCIQPIMADARGVGLDNVAIAEQQQVTNAEKDLNFKHMDTIYNQDLLVPSSSTVIEVAQFVNQAVVVCRNAARPQSLNIPFYRVEKVGIDITPVIYDENQLQMSGNPVVEENIDCSRTSQ